MLTVSFTHCSYPIHIGHSIFENQALWQSLIASSQVCIVTNETIAPLYLSQLTAVFSGHQCDTVILPDGEVHKQLDAWLQIINTLAEKNHRRNTTLIALGGGVVGDLTGFAAACYQRGVHFIQVPTTLLAQVDASIGGKTGVNYHEMKNFIGAFYQPKAVIIDTDFLSSLPEREFRAGLAEVIKYALIRDKAFFDYLCQHVEAILGRSSDVLAYIIEVSCRTKIYFIEQDQFDQTGVRALLNFGHTFGHALESVLHYNILHGEAVAWGMRKACQLSQYLGYLSEDNVTQVNGLFKQLGLLISPPVDIEIDALLAFMRNDKKNNNDAIAVVLLKNLGDAFMTNEVASSLIKKIVSDFL